VKRLHVHVSVENVEDAVKFYSTMFGAQPVKLKPDYAKWLLDDPSVNFAISAKGRKPGLDHFGIQVDEEKELSEVRDRIAKAELATFDEEETTCCYAKSDKTWVMDPAGVAWEAYQFMGDAEIFHEAKMPPAPSTSCRAPKEKNAAEAKPESKKSGCCG
jgi:catechol 2,3-dioxygenase-like lactoylglutathione lyase family enzyme